MKVDITDLRRVTRIPLPEDDNYVYSLGIAIYAFNYLTNFLSEVITYIDPLISRSSLERLSAGEVLTVFNKARMLIESPGLTDCAARVALAYQELKDQRNDIIHANPVTGSDGMQVLYRNQETKTKHFEVAENFILNFCCRLDALVDDLEIIRTGTKIA